jgi:hypothetical protein
MALSNSQKWLCKRAQAQTQLSDADYRGLWHDTVPGVTSSTDPKLTDRQMDKFLAFAEAIYWRRVDAGEITHNPKRGHDPFISRAYWSNKNTKQSTSRERYAAHAIASEIQTLEATLGQLGYGGEYCARILENVMQGRAGASPEGPPSGADLVNYRAALRRTLNAKRKEAHAHT